MRDQVGDYKPICVICAKPDELEHVVPIFEANFAPSRGSHPTHQVFSVPYGPDAGATGEKLEIFATTCVGMGHMNAAIRTAQVINSHQPKVLIFLGTAASLKPAKVQVGDVVIPRKAISRYYEKISESGQDDYDRRRKDDRFLEYFFGDTALISDVATADCSADALAAGAGIPVKDVTFEAGPLVTVKVGDQTYSLREPKLFRDIDILSCGMVVDSVSYREFLTSLADESMRNVGVIDMESHGFFKAIDASQRVGVGAQCTGIMIRGVSDYAGRKQQTEALPVGWKEIAIRNGAQVACMLIKRLARV